MHLRRQPVDLAAIAHAIAAQLRAGAPSRTVEVTIDEPLAVSGDPAMLELALGRLLALSWELTRARPVGRVHVGTLAGPDGQVIFVRDNGLGATEPDDPGLAEIVGVVAAHGGRLWTESAPGAGATIYFTLGR